MITVRFPSGFSLQYNDLDSVDTRGSYHYLGKKKDPGYYSVIAPLDCIIEYVAPCRAYNPTLVPNDKVQAEVALLSKEIRSMKRKLDKK